MEVLAGNSMELRSESKLRMNRRALSLCVAVGVLGLTLGSAPGDKKQEEEARLASTTKNFQTLRETLKEFNSNFKGAVTETVRYEKLLDAKEEAKTWQCQSALDNAKEKSKSARKTLGTLSDRLKTKLDAAKGAAVGLLPAQLPWGSDFDAVSKTAGRARDLFRVVNSAKTSEGPKSLASLWTRVQEYTGGIPDCLPPAAAEEMVPPSVTVPCIMITVKMR